VFDEIYSSQKIKTVDEVQSFYNGNLVSVIDFADEYQNIIERHAQIYEIPVELMSEPIVYEVPVDVRDKIETADKAT
jgi:tartrate dehydratase beta subunit/fumarate hydratase class I family protein